MKKSGSYESQSKDGDQTLFRDRGDKWASGGNRLIEKESTDAKWFLSEESVTIDL